MIRTHEIASIIRRLYALELAAGLAFDSDRTSLANNDSLTFTNSDIVYFGA